MVLKTVLLISEFEMSFIPVRYLQADLLIFCLYPEGKLYRAVFRPIINDRRSYGT